MSNGRVERGALKLIKSDRHNSLSENTLDHLVRIPVDGPPLAQWGATVVVQLWWWSNTRAAPRPCPSSANNDPTEEYTLNLEDWTHLLLE